MTFTFTLKRGCLRNHEAIFSCLWRMSWLWRQQQSTRTHTSEWISSLISKELTLQFNLCNLPKRLSTNVQFLKFLNKKPLAYNCHCNQRLSNRAIILPGCYQVRRSKPWSLKLFVLIFLTVYLSLLSWPSIE